MLCMQQQLELAVELEALLWQFVVCVPHAAPGVKGEREREVVLDKLLDAVRLAVCQRVDSSNSHSHDSIRGMRITVLKHKLW